ncbi:hypothetical protein EYV94_07920 [Puteibacter caeruleilacunae]|nr:hypothetical protein EYV94_07920 [Puteibacter caeruleilacunae]
MKNRVFKISAFLTLIAFVATLGTFQGCKKSVSPVPYYVPEAAHTVTITVKEDKDGKPALGGVSAAVTYPGESSPKNEPVGSNGVLNLNVKEKQDGLLKIAFTKDGFIESDAEVTIQRDNKNADWTFESVVLMTEANDPVVVTPSEEKQVDVEESEATAVFPVGSVAKEENITITETPTAVEVAEESGEVEVVEGKVPLRTFNFQPDGLVFTEDKEMEISFPIPDVAGDLKLSTFKDGAWEEVDVEKSVDGTTGTAKVPHFSDWHLTEPITWTTSKKWSTWTTLTGQVNKDFTPNFNKTVTFAVGGDNVSYTFDVDGQEYAKRADHKVEIQVRYEIFVLTPSVGSPIESVTGVVDWSEAEYKFVGHSGGSGN